MSLRGVLSNVEARLKHAERWLEALALAEDVRPIDLIEVCGSLAEAIRGLKEAFLVLAEGAGRGGTADGQF